MMIANFSQMAVVGMLLMTLGLSRGAKLRGQGGAERKAAEAMENEMRKLDLCNLAVSLTCTVGYVGVECRSFQATPDRCLYDNTYTYKLENLGVATLDITEAISQVPGAPPTDLIRFVPMQLEAGQSTTVIQTQRVDYCQTAYVTATVMAKANPGQCEAQATHAFK